MIELGRHIEILLLSNDCVMVPELGGFMAHHVVAHYDEREHSFLPPLRALGFNPQLKLNDSLLAQSYVEAYDISYPEALRRIEEEVDELKQHLDNDGKYELNDIGILKMNEEGIYVFEPCEAGILTPELYGLSSFEMREMSNECEELCVVAAAQEENVHTNGNNKDTTLLESRSQEPQTENDDDSTIKIKISWIRNIVAAAAAVIAFLFTTTPVSNSNRQPLDGLQTANFLNIRSQEIKVAPDTTIYDVKANDIALSDTTAKTHVRAEKHGARADTLPANKSKGYCIVLASHVTKKNAESYVNELHDKGYTEAYTYIKNNIVRVVYGNYESEDDARSALHDVRGNRYFEQSWIYKKR